MSKAVIIRIGDSKFFVETDESTSLPALYTRSGLPLPGVPPGLTPVVDLHSLERNFGEINDVIVSCCNQLFEAITEIPQPQKILIEFGIKFAGEAGVPMLTKASGEANFKISVEWIKPEKPR